MHWKTTAVSQRRWLLDLNDDQLSHVLSSYRFASVTDLLCGLPPVPPQFTIGGNVNTNGSDDVPRPPTTCQLMLRHDAEGAHVLCHAIVSPSNFIVTELRGAAVAVQAMYEKVTDRLSHRSNFYAQEAMLSMRLGWLAAREPPDVIATFRTTCTNLESVFNLVLFPTEKKLIITSPAPFRPTVYFLPDELQDLSPTDITKDENYAIFRYATI